MWKWKPEVVRFMCKRNYAKIFKNKKVRNKTDNAAIESFCSRHNLPIIGTIPHDETFIEAERNERSPIDFAPESPGVLAISEIANKLTAFNRPPAQQKEAKSTVRQ